MLTVQLQFFLCSMMLSSIFYQPVAIATHGCMIIMNYCWLTASEQLKMGLFNRWQLWISICLIYLLSFQMKLEHTGVDQRPQVLDPRLPHQPATVCEDCVWDTVVCSTGAPQGTVLAPFLFTLYTADFYHQSPHCHLQKFSDDSAIVGLIRDGDRAYRKLIQDFVDWCQRNHLQLNAGKTKELVVDFRRHRQPCTQVNILGTDRMTWHLTSTLEFTWTINLTGLITPQLHTRKVRADSICWGSSGPLECMGTSWQPSMTLCWHQLCFIWRICCSSSISAAGRRRLDKLTKKASSILGCPLDPVQVVGESRMMDKLSSLLVQESRPLQVTISALGSSISDRLIHPQSVKERYHRSFLPAAVRLYNQHCSMYTSLCTVQ